MCTAVLLPARFVRFIAERLFFAVADGLDAPRGNAGLRKRVAGGAGAAVAQCQVVFGRATLVAVPLDRELPVGMLLQECGARSDLLLRVSTDRVGVVIEEDIFH